MLVVGLACSSPPPPTPTISVYEVYPAAVADLLPQDVYNCTYDRETARLDRLSPEERATQEAQMAEGMLDEWYATLHTQGLSCWALYASDAEYVRFMDSTGGTMLFLPSWQLCIEDAMGLLEGVVATVVYARLGDLSVFSAEALRCLPSPTATPPPTATPQPFPTPIQRPTPIPTLPPLVFDLEPTFTPISTPTPFLLDIQVVPPLPTPRFTPAPTPASTGPILVTPNPLPTPTVSAPTPTAPVTVNQQWSDRWIEFLVEPHVCNGILEFRGRAVDGSRVEYEASRYVPFTLYEEVDLQSSFEAWVRPAVPPIASYLKPAPPGTSYPGLPRHQIIADILSTPPSGEFHLRADYPAWLPDPENVALGVWGSRPEHEVDALRLIEVEECATG